MAVRSDQEVYSWGASPQEMRVIQSRHTHKQNNGLPVNGVSLDSWKNCAHVYSGNSQRPIDQVAVGYRHCAILHSGKILLGKNKDDELNSPKLKDKDNISFFTYKFLHVSCGLDYTMAIDQIGKLLAWGSPSMAQVSV